MKKELRRSAADCKIFGVCGGIAEYFSIDSNLVRLIWVAVSLFAGTGVLLYIIAAVIMPKADNMEQDLQDVIHPEDDASQDLQDVIHPGEDDASQDLQDVIHPEEEAED